LGDKLVPHEDSGLRHSEEDQYRAELKRQYKSLGFLKKVVARPDFVLPDVGSLPFIFAHFGETPVVYT